MEGYETSQLERLDRLLSELNTQSLLVVSNGRVLYSFGDVSDTGYIASVRKSVLAILFGPYVEAGNLSLNDTLETLGIDDHLGLSHQEKQARVADLLRSRSGVYHPAANGGDSLASAPPRGSKSPGSYFLYNNWDFNALGHIFEQQTGVSVYTALALRLAEPLAFQDFDLSEQELHGDESRSQYLAYHMFLSARDLARIGVLMLNEGRWHGQQLISREWIRTITSETTDFTDMHPANQREQELDFGILWWLFDERHSNEAYQGAYVAQGSYGQFLLVVPKYKLVIAHKTRYQPVSNAQEYHSVSVSWEQFMQIADTVVGARIREPSD